MPKKAKRGAVDRKAAVFMRVYIAALLLFSIWIVLDQFVIPHDYMEMQQAVFVEWTATIEPSPTPEPAAPTPEAASTVAASPTPTASPHAHALTHAGPDVRPVQGLLCQRRRAD